MSKIEKILILDESDTNVLFFEMLLRGLERDFQIFTASAGAQAELIFKQQKIQMVICAWEMSSMPGTVFVQRIRQSSNRKYVPCIIFSKRMSPEEVTLTKELGYEDILGMPFDKKSASEMIINIVDYEDNLSSDEKKIRKIESLISQGLLTEALKFFDNKLTSKGPFKIRAKLSLAEIWLQTRNFEKAESILEDILSTEADHTDAQKMIARLYSLTERHEQAIEVLKKVTERSPKNIDSLLCLGSAYMDADQTENAKSIFDKVEKMDSENSQLNDEKGKLAFKEGNISLAAQLLSETQCGDDLARHFNNVAISKVTHGSYDEGIATYQNAIQLLTDKAKLHQLHYNLGLALKKKGDLLGSFENLCESYVSNPSFEKAYAALAKVSKEIKAGGNKLDPELVEKVKDARKRFKEGLDGSQNLDQAG